MKRTAIERFTSRPFLLTVVSAVAAIFGAFYGISADKIALIVAAITPFVLGESYRDGKSAEAQTAMPDNLNIGATITAGASAPDYGALPAEGSPDEPGDNSNLLAGLNLDELIQNAVDAGRASAQLDIENAATAAAQKVLSSIIVSVKP